MARADAQFQSGYQQPGCRQVIGQGGQQETEGGPGVADGPEGGGQIVIGEGEEHPRQDDPQVGHGVVHQLRRGLDQQEKGTQKDQGEEDRRRCGSADEHAGDEELLAQAGEVLLSEEAGHQDGGPHTGPGDDIDEQVHHALGHPQGCEGIPADVAGDDQGVDDIVQLLEHIGGQQRQAQADQLGRDGSGGEFGLSGHGETSPSVIGAASIIVRNLPFVNGREKRAAIWDAFQGSTGKNWGSERETTGCGQICPGHPL